VAWRQSTPKNGVAIKRKNIVGGVTWLKTKAERSFDLRENKTGHTSARLNDFTHLGICCNLQELFGSQRHYESIG
jgi:hypothetical protein